MGWTVKLLLALLLTASVVAWHDYSVYVRPECQSYSIDPHFVIGTICP